MKIEALGVRNDHPNMANRVQPVVIDNQCEPFRLLELDAKTKQPFAIAMKDDKPYALAGLWEKWKDSKAGVDLLTFTVITTDPNEVVQPMHDRMPVIIPEREYGRWLDVSDTQRLPLDLLRPFDSDKMTAWKVDKAVGNVKNDNPELIEPASATPEQAEEPLPERPGSLFP